MTDNTFINKYNLVGISTIHNGGKFKLGDIVQISTQKALVEDRVPLSEDIDPVEFSLIYRNKKNEVIIRKHYSNVNSNRKSGLDWIFRDHINVERLFVEQGVSEIDKKCGAYESYNKQLKEKGL